MQKSPNQSEPIILLAGNPNTGKTSLFNILCGTNQRVGNYPGVTVDRKKGQTIIKGQNLTVVDIPGTYSLKADSPDELLANDTLMGRALDIGRPDIVVLVIDSTNLKRNLFLFSQIAQCDLPLVVALTMTDLLESNGISINIEKFEFELGVPVVAINPKNPLSIVKLKERIADSLINPKFPLHSIKYPEKLQEAIHQLKFKISDFEPISDFEAENILFYESDQLSIRLSQNEKLKEAINTIRQRARNENLIVKTLISTLRYNWAEKVTKSVEFRKPTKSKTISQKIDYFLTHRFLGFAFFTAIMYLVFSAVYAWASPLMDFIDESFGSLGDLAGTYFASNPMLQSLVTDGIIAGVGSVVIFLPQIIILFTLITLLEDSGYLARAAFLMDKLLSWTGLNGRSFIPMLSCFACAIPGIMATRVIPDKRARMLTILVAPLMSCSARLPVYILLIGAFIEPQYGAAMAALSLFLMQGIGLFFAMPIAYLFNRKLLKTRPLPFILEMPPYRAPRLKNVYFRVWEASRKFLVQVGTIVFFASIFIWGLSYFPRPAEVENTISQKYDERIEILSTRYNASETEIAAMDSRKENEIASTYLEQSYLGRIGKTIEPIFAPLGFDWKISVGILGAFPARELIIATLGVLYNVGDDVNEESGDLRQKMIHSKDSEGRPIFRPLVAISLMVFFALCAQCMSTLATAKRELNSWKLAGFMFFYMTFLAYASSFLIYQIGTYLGF